MTSKVTAQRRHTANSRRGPRVARPGDRPTAESPNEETDQAIDAECTISPLIHGALVFDALKNDFFGPERTHFLELVAQMRKHAEKVRRGDLARVGSMLITQAIAMQGIFASSVRQARQSASQHDCAVAMDIALRAQDQSRQALQTLLDLKRLPNRRRPAAVKPSRGRSHAG